MKDVLKLFIYPAMALFFYSSIIYGIQNNDKWFSRACIALVLMGVLYLGEILEQKENDN